VNQQRFGAQFVGAVSTALCVTFFCSVFCPPPRLLRPTSVLTCLSLCLRPFHHLPFALHLLLPFHLHFPSTFPIDIKWLPLALINERTASGDVANPSELLLFAKKKKEDSRAVEGSKRRQDGGSEMLNIIREGEEDAIFKINIEDLVNETLSGGNKPLSVLVETEMTLALEDFVVKRQVNAITDIVQESLERMQRELHLDKEVTVKSGIAEAATKFKKKVEESFRKGEKPPARAPRAPRIAGPPGSDGDDVNSGSEDEVEIVPKKKSAARGKSAASSSATATATGEMAFSSSVIWYYYHVKTSLHANLSAHLDSTSSASARRGRDVDEMAPPVGRKKPVKGDRTAADSDSDGQDRMDEQVQDSDEDSVQMPPSRTATTKSTGRGRGSASVPCSSHPFEHPL
jgi:Mre11 DNA-binding presumed domain